MRIIAGLRRGMKLAAPPGLQTRPVLDRVKQSWFDVLGNVLADAGVLDVFSGVGSLGLEALSRGARRCVFVERAPECLALLRGHLERSGFAERSVVMTAPARDALEQLGSRGERFDAIFLDPPFALAAGQDFYASGGLLDAAGRLLAPDGSLMLRREGGEVCGGDGGASLGDTLRVRDRRRWGRSEVLFMERGDPDA